MSEDGLVPATSELDPEAVRPVTDVETLKALADPVRLSILSAMMRGPGGLRVMSVKELAAELDEPQTKLYRHIKQLEAVGLIKSVASRLVSGILEHRYQACQDDLIIGPGLTESQKSSAQAEATVAAALEMYRRQFFAAHRAAKNDGQGPADRQLVLGMRVARVTRAQAADILARLQKIEDDLTSIDDAAESDGTEADDSVKINVLLGYFSPVDATS